MDQKMSVFPALVIFRNLIRDSLFKKTIVINIYDNQLRLFD